MTSIDTENDSRSGQADDTFTLAYTGFDPADEGLRETLTSTGNGYLATRGAAEWEHADDTHYPGTYIHGLHNRATTILAGVPVVNEDLVNLPDWLPMSLRIDGGEVLRLAEVELLDYQHELDLRDALLTRRIRFRDPRGRETELRSRRFVSMAERHHAHLEWTLTPLNWSGAAEVVTAIDGRVTNTGVPRYRQLESTHLLPVATEFPARDVMALKTRTRESEIHVAVVVRTVVHTAGREVAVPRTDLRTPDHIQQTLHLDLRRGVPVTIDKAAAVVTSRDAATGETMRRAGREIARARRFEAAHVRHRAAWDRLWRGCDVRVVGGDDEAQHLLRVHICHLLQTCSHHTADMDAGVPARGINGEAYRGHVFWDEMFVYPFLTHRAPEITRGMLQYRYRRRAEAQMQAEASGYRGFMYPWQSGSIGSEETQKVHLNPMSGRWDPDLSHNQRHVSAAIFYSVWHYVTITGDTAFLRAQGAELMLGITRFWASIAHFSPERQRYEIHGVMGPDEYHEKYPDAAEGGLRNNAYTNVFVAWICHVAAGLLDRLPAEVAEEMRERLELRDGEIERWRDMSRRMFVPFHDGVMSQFEGYEQLEELDWDRYRRRYGSIQRLDRILKAEGDSPDRYRLTKQADVVMLFYLFTDDELREIFDRLGYDFPADAASRTIAYYDHRTSHGSTLSHITHAGVSARFDPDGSWERFLVALSSDVHDIQGGTTREGIHLGVMAGTVDVIQRFYAGMRVEDGVLVLEPNLPGRIEGVSFDMTFRGAPLTVTVMRDGVTVRHRGETGAGGSGAGGAAPAGPGSAGSVGDPLGVGPVSVRVAGRECLLPAGAEEAFALR